MRATQAAIDEKLGLDYETFVNSTFLLQGRSDEFTRKKPGERKLILGKILGLDRYERLATAAGGRVSALKTQVASLDAEAERLVAATAQAPQWQVDRDALARDIETTEAEAARLDAALAESATALAALDAAAADDARLAAALQTAETRLSENRSEAARLDTRIAEADALITQSDLIEADHALYETVRARRTVLDEAATVHRALGQRAAEIQLRIQKEVADAETRIERLALDLEVLRERVRDDAKLVETRPAAEKALADADAAVTERAALEQIRTRRETAQKLIDGVDRRLAADRGALIGTQAELTGQVDRLRAATAAADPSEAADLERRAAAASDAADGLEVVRETGTALAAEIGALDAEVARLAQEASALRERQARAGQTDDAVCPTCGTELTDDHREHVARAIAQDLASITTQQEKAMAARDRAVARRDALRSDFQRLRAAADAGKAAGEALAALKERTARRTSDLERLAAVEKELAGVAASLAAETFSQPDRAMRAEAERVLDASPFDAARFDAVAASAQMREHHARALREIDVAEARRAERIIEGKRKAADLEAQRAALDRGEPAQASREALHTVEQQMAASGYDAGEHARVGAEMTRLAEAPTRLARLLEVRRSAAEWAERRAALASEALGLEAEARRVAAGRADLAARLAARPAAEAERAGLVGERDVAARRLSDAHAHRGALDERLEQAARDRAALAAARHELRDARKEQKLYTELRKAFSRNGIPSLIIEETLPDVEDRANVLLERLTGGTTRVALETLRDNKTTGGTRETLDITITDAQGAPRAYEMYSGGEAFRVNFALRIALSQLLAERAGTQIRTLVIDEGFGTQDAEGLAALVQAIRTIQDDFDKILVVTHLEELKNAFPVRIEVRKDPLTGSTFDVVGM